MDSIKVLEHNKSYIVCIKPQGVTSEDGQKPGLPTLLEVNGKKPLVVHRLDREVAGVMVLAKSQKAAADLSRQIAEHTFSKEYLAVVFGEVEEYGVLEDLLYHDRVKNKTYPVKSPRNGVKKAKLEYWRLGAAETSDGVLSLVRVKLYTGRTHQIRVQFASRQHPIVGDRKYGSKINADVALFSRLIGFLDESKGQKMFTATPENKYPWSLFDKAVFEI